MSNFSFEEALTEVWRPSLIDNATTVVLEGKQYFVSRTPKRALTPVDLAWAQLARSDTKVMSFLSEERSVANQVDGKVILHGKRTEGANVSSGTFSENAMAHSLHSATVLSESHPRRARRSLRGPLSV